jgi:hypothetical protein
MTSCKDSPTPLTKRRSAFQTYEELRAHIQWMMKWIGNGKSPPTSVPLSNNKLFDGAHNEWEEIHRSLFISSLTGLELAILRKSERPNDASSKELVNPYKMSSPPKDPGNSHDDFLATENVTTFKESIEQGLPTLSAKQGCYISRQDAVRLCSQLISLGSGIRRNGMRQTLAA